MTLRMQPRRALITVSLLLAALAWLALGSGSVALAPGELAAVLLRGLARWAGIGTQAPQSLAETAVVSLRLPRVLLAMACGAGLALAGATMQALFRNPLADPALIGVSAGAAVGAAATTVLGAALLSGSAAAGSATAGYAAAGSVAAAPSAAVWAQSVAAPIAACAGGWLAVALVVRVARVGSRLDAATMLLAGIAINALAGAAIGFLAQLADDRQLRGLTFWTFGSLSGAGWGGALAVCGALAAGVWALRGRARPLNALLLGDADAGHLGVDVERLKRRLVAVAAVVTGVAVSACGTIGFVGLVAPHLARLAVGPDHRWLLPLSAACGAALLVAADWAARTWFAPSELPIGVLTALIGAPLFIGLLRSAQRRDGDD
jgi:iron complex transport system permease protein